MNNDFKNYIEKNVNNYNKNKYKCLPMMTNVIADLMPNDINWITVKNTICKLYQLTDGARLQKEKMRVSQAILLDYLYYCVKKEDYKNDDKYILIENETNIRHFFSLSALVNKKRMILETPNITPYSFYSMPHVKGLGLFAVPNLTKEKINFLNKYINSLNENKKNALVKKSFVTFVYIVFGKKGNLYSSINDYDDNSFETHIKESFTTQYLSEAKQHRSNIALAPFAVVDFYLWIVKTTSSKRFVKYNYSVLKYPRLIEYLYKGYYVEKYSLYDTPPEKDKWILDCSTSGYLLNAYSDVVMAIDFSIVSNPILRRIVKECFWNDQKSIKKRYKIYRPVIDFCNMYIKSPNSRITDTTIYEYEYYLKKNSKTDIVISNNTSMIKYFLSYCNERGILNIDPIAFKAFSFTDNHKEGKNEGYTIDEMNLLTEAYKKEYQKADNNRILKCKEFYYIMKIQEASEMRISSILSLSTNPFIKILNSKKGEWKVQVASKTKKDGYDEYLITNYTKCLIDNVIKLTSSIRKEAIGIEREMLFIYKRNNSRGIGIIRQDSCAEYHEKICEKYNIRNLGMGGIRNYRSQIIDNYISEKYDGDIARMEKLNGRKQKVTMRHYDKVDINSFSQDYYHVQIGDYNLKAKFEKETNLPENTLVRNGCGHCDNESHIGCIDCRICKNLVLTPADIPSLEKEIEEIDELLLHETIEHERDFLIVYKEFDVACIAKLLELQGDNYGETYNI